MKITQIRFNGKLPSPQLLRDIVLMLELKIGQADFITNVGIVSRSGIKLGLRSKSFLIDTTKMPHNIQYSAFRSTGKRTSLPTWDQRVEYNDLVNAVLTELGVSAMVTSGPYLIRDGMHAYTENDWHNAKPEWIRENEHRGQYVDGPNEFSETEFKKRQAKTLTTVNAVIACRREA